jgi:hypothetical protein
MEELLIDNKFLNINLIDSIDILGLSVETLHSKFYTELLIKEEKSAPPEVLLQIPPRPQVMTSQELDVRIT